MIKISLVGDIGSGKTFVSKLFRAPCFFADARPDAIPGQKDPEGHLFFPRLPVPGFPQKPVARP